MRTIQRILVANRSEIALRIIRTARDMEIATSAVYADQDITADFANEADDAWALGGTTLAQTYMNMDRIIELALETGADAIHPGYGFLSENPDFAEAVESAGLIWIGPTSTVINALGDKIRARKVAQSCGVHPVPGVSTPLSTRADVESFVTKHGYPIMLKRSDGGGGHGISIIHNKDDLDMFFTRHIHINDSDATEEHHEKSHSSVTADSGKASSEENFPQKSTDNTYDLEKYFIERYVTVARHVETQCMRDKLGNFRIVSTRDCSLQRRNQKLIEEAPAPFLPDGVENTLRSWSQNLFEKVNYVGVGTCEFLLEPNGSVWFLEVNPRLQVEHTVSEEVAGIDLVREQIRIAQGLPLDAEQIHRGHSFEFRITCEDPANNLTPTAGRVHGLHWPSGPGIRLEIGINEGDEVVTDFDSMFAKIIVTGINRDHALARARRALSEFHIEGVPTPVELYQDLLCDPAVIGTDSFSISTKWLEEHFLPIHSYESHDNDVQIPDSQGRTPARETYVIELDGHRMNLTIPQGLLATNNHSLRPHQPLRSARSDFPNIHSTNEGTSVQKDGTVVSPMQAIVIAIPVHIGQHVDEGDLITVLEAMKMEKYIKAPFPGVIKTIFARNSDSVSMGMPLLQIERENA